MFLRRTFLDLSMSPPLTQDSGREKMTCLGSDGEPSWALVTVRSTAGRRVSTELGLTSSMPPDFKNWGLPEAICQVAALTVSRPISIAKKTGEFSSGFLRLVMRWSSSMWQDEGAKQTNLQEPRRFFFCRPRSTLVW